MHVQIDSSSRMPVSAFRGRRFTKDQMMTFDRPLAGADAAGNNLGIKFAQPCKVGDKTYDTSGAFLIGELERLDQTEHGPLVDITWSRDVPQRTDVTIADEVSSFTVSTFAAPGGLGTGNGIGNGKSWIQKNTTEIPNVGLDIGKVVNPLHPWALELSYTVFELESAARLGRPVDAQKYDALQLKHEMDLDEQTYIGDTVFGDGGLLNNSGVTATNVAAGASGFTQWTQKTPDEILTDVNQALTTTWANSGWAVMPNKLLIPPAQYGYISTQKISSAGNQSILRYLLENNLIKKSKNAQLEVEPLKWSIGAGAGGTIGTTGTVDRMTAYTQEEKYVRLPFTDLQRMPLQYDGIYHKAPYYCRIGRVEIVYPQTLGYYDGI